MLLGRRQPSQVLEVGVQVDLLDRPGVLDGIAEPVVELGITHRTQGEVHPRVEQVLGTHGGHWQASQLSGFSSEQATASAMAGWLMTVACWILVAGRERR